MRGLKTAGDVAAEAFRVFDQDGELKNIVSLRRMPRIAAEPFMRVVGEMLDLDEEVATEGDVL